MGASITASNWKIISKNISQNKENLQKVFDQSASSGL